MGAPTSLDFGSAGHVCSEGAQCPFLHQRHVQPSGRRGERLGLRRFVHDLRQRLPPQRLRRRDGVRDGSPSRLSTGQAVMRALAPARIGVFQWNPIMPMTAPIALNTAPIMVTKRLVITVTNVSLLRKNRSCCKFTASMRPLRLREGVTETDLRWEARL